MAEMTAGADDSIRKRLSAAEQRLRALEKQMSRLLAAGADDVSDRGLGAKHRTRAGGKAARERRRAPKRGRPTRVHRVASVDDGAFEEPARPGIESRGGPRRSVDAVKHARAYVGVHSLAHRSGSRTS